MRQASRISGGYDQPACLLGTVGGAPSFQRPPHFRVSVPETTLEFDPFSRVLRPAPVRAQSHPFYPANLPYPVPPGVGGLQRQHVGDLSMLKPFLELAMLPIEDISDHRPEGDLYLQRPLDQLQSYLRLGAKGRVALSTLKVVSGGVGLDLHRIVDPLLSIQARDRHHAIVYLPDPTKILLTDVCRRLAIFAVAGLVYDQDARALRSRLRIFEHQIHPAPI